MKNTLYYGDNLTIMQGLPRHSVDLIYLDPPFKSQQNYNLLYRTLTGKPIPEQEEAFCDTWNMDAQKDELARNMPVLMREYGVSNEMVDFWALWMKALRKTQPHLLAYLIYMVQRLLHMRVILRPTGSIYLHCDPAASHYIKVMMDAIFDHNNFRSELIWKRTSSHNSAKRWGPVHDTILFYTASSRYTWNRVSQPYDKDYVASFYKHEDELGKSYRLGDLTGAGTRSGESGRPWRGVNPTDSGRHWAVPGIPGKTKEEIKALTVQERLDALDELKLIYWPKRGSIPQFKRYFDESKGVAAQDIITDIDPLSPHASEKMGYPTQKPIELLERIIKASSNPGDVVFDPFCGCGTTIYAAERTQRKWIGCDVAILAVRLIRERLTDRYHLTEGSQFEVKGVPNSVDSAQALFKTDPFQFQHWAVERVEGYPTAKKTGDQGIDGKLYFETRDGLRDMVLSVKGGMVRPTDIRDLRGVLEREDNAELAGFISLQEPSKAMREEAERAGFYTYNGLNYRRIQLLTIKEIVEDKKQFHTPSKVRSRTVRGQASFNYDTVSA
jgi:DNA modification methylase